MHTEGHAFFPQFLPFKGKLYAAWHEIKNSTYQIQIVVFNGNTSSPSWTPVYSGTGINYDATKSANLVTLTEYDDHLIASWGENNGSSEKIRVAVYNGNDSNPSWNFIDGGSTSGINYDKQFGSFHPHLAVINNTLHATWHEQGNDGGQIRVARYSGDLSSSTWVFLDGNGLNFDVSKQAYYPYLIGVDSKVYTIWSESNGTAQQIRIAARTLIQ